MKMRGRTSNEKKKYRYRWPDEIRDDVLARLLELNRQRALEEGQVVIRRDGSDARRESEKDKQQETKREESQAGFHGGSVRDGSRGGIADAGGTEISRSPRQAG